MKNKLKISILLLFVATFSFSQNAINKCKANIKDQLVKLDSTKTAPTATKKMTLKKGVVVKTATARTEGLPVKGATVKCGKNPGASAIVIITKDDGSFSSVLEEGNYTISIQADELKKTIAKLKEKEGTINGATFIFDLPANFEFSGTNKSNENGEYVAPKYEFNITVPKEGITFSGKLLTSTTAGLSIKPTVNEKGNGSPKAQGF